MPRLTPASLARPVTVRRDERPPFWWLRWVPAFTVAAIILYLLYEVGQVIIIPLLSSFALAYLLNPIVERIEAHGLSRPLAAVLALLMVAGALAALLWLIVPDLWTESVAAGDIVIQNFNPQKAREVGAKIREISPLAYRTFGWRVEQFLRSPNNLYEVTRTWFAGSLTNFLATASASLDLLLIPFFVYYILVDFRRWRDSSEDLIPPRFREPFTRLFDEVGRILQSYVLGQLMIAMIMGVLYAIGFWALGVPAWAGIALLSGLLNLIPYVGTGMGIVMASGFTFADGGGLWRIGGVVGVFVAVQSVEGYFLTPRILGGRLSLHPMAVFLGLLIGGKMFGFLGVLLAVPVIAVAQVFLKFLREIYKGSFFYHAGDAGPEEAPREAPQMLAKAADTVLAEQVEEQKGDELLAPKKEEDDPAARQKTA
jgi:predicted PurR-regulated permease PerM